MAIIARMGIHHSFAALALLVACGAQASVLRVEQAGEGVVQREAQSLRLERGQVLAEGDAVRVAPGARVTLALGRHGYLDLGGGAELAIERVPFSTFADDLRTVLRLRAGYLRVVWKHPDLAGRWPLSLFVESHALSLESGEYFFERLAGGDLACVGSGQAALGGGPSAATLTGPACYRLLAGAMPEARRRDYGDFIGVRERFGLASLAERPGLDGPVRPVAVAPAIAVPAPPPVTKPAPQPEPVRAPPPAPVREAPRPRPSADLWIVNAASYPSRAEAEAHRDRLRAAGRQPAIEQAQVRGKTWFRVQLRDLDGKAAAQRLAEELKASGESSDAWLSRQR